MSRRTKQLIYGSAFILALIALTGALYLAFMPEQDCGNKRKDWGEEGVDCGGKCAKVCIPEDITPIAPTGDVLLFHPNEDVASVVVEVGNPNADFAGKTFNYRIDLYGDGDRLLGSFAGRSYIYGGELKYLTGYFRSREASRVRAAEISITEVEWVPNAEFEKPPVVIRERDAARSPEMIEIKGKAVNNHTVEVAEVFLVAIMKGNSGVPVGVSETKLLNMKPGEVRDFRIVHPPLETANLARTEYFISARRSLGE